MLFLRQVTAGNPFSEHPQLRAIWPQPYCAIAEEAVVEHLAQCNEFEIGGIYTICDENKVVGITGYFIFNEDATVLGLRWHGLIKAYRGRGLSERVIEAVLIDAVSRFPQVDTLIELVPLSDYGKPLLQHFTRLGFVAQGEPERYDWSSDAWQPMQLAVGTFLQRRGYTYSDATSTATSNSDYTL